MAAVAIMMPRSQEKTELRFTNRFPSDLPVAILIAPCEIRNSDQFMHAMRPGIRNYALLFVGCVFFHIAGTWNLPLIDRDEPRFAEASREMIERGDYVVPYFNNHFRFDKPPLTYWAQIASYKIFGENDFAARFPSAIAAALTALSLLAWGSRVGQARVGWCSAVIFTLSLQTFLHAKAAVADMWLVLFVTLAHWAGYELLRNSLQNSPARPAVAPYHQMHWGITFYVALALGFLAKGPIAWTPLLTVWITIIFARNLQLARRFKFLLGIPLMLAIVAVWGISALIQTHGEFFAIGIGRHVIGRSFGAMEGHGANSFGMYLLLLPFYFVTIFLSFFPWSLKLPWLIRKLWGERKVGILRLRQGYRGRADPDYNGNKINNYLVIGIAIIFVIFTLVKTKLPHYTLPAFSLLSLLLARHWVHQRTAIFKAIAVVTACLWLAIALIVPPFIARSFPAYALFQESREYLRSEMQFGVVNYEEPSLIWYFRSRVRGWMTSFSAASASQFMAEGGPRFVVLPSQVAAKIFPNQPPNWKTFSAHGFNIAKGKRVDLALVLKPE
jgi:4-amino-4-deoxy-L-arabinose transferase-like glycosyltransferase